MVHHSHEPDPAHEPFAIDIDSLNQHDDSVEPTLAFDPLRLCVFSTVALLAWLLGPIVVVVFAAVAIVGYAKARRAGLKRSRCKLGDTRLVLTYLCAVAAAALVGVGFQVFHLVELLRVWW